MDKEYKHKTYANGIKITNAVFDEAGAVAKRKGLTKQEFNQQIFDEWAKDHYPKGFGTSEDVPNIPSGKEYYLKSVIDREVERLK